MAITIPLPAFILTLESDLKQGAYLLPVADCNRLLEFRDQIFDADERGDTERVMELLEEAVALLPRRQRWGVALEVHRYRLAMTAGTAA